jgi:hypothetical protein
VSSGGSRALDERLKAAVYRRSKPASFNDRDKSGRTSEAIHFLTLLAPNDRSRDAGVLPGAHGHFDNALPEMGTTLAAPGA